ncbi:pinin/SDK/memA/ protein conserved region-domain-containing protein [Clohesyomyces aquaticus]|uniref:Pinin/SDK/memA/ protein conserved region-domain-containing protein n=1 Tax=Clohesyomyces aquaticus TaxID=1231657 RepID=A0A1Y1ZYL1_9PLEO|nr:pinin/SDK/memA/ protein conserved region-domain-containing protein [Clohesyomyces aquaticus]
MDGIASAVMLPEPQESPTPEASATASDAPKRRQSSTPEEQDGKRQRVNSLQDSSSQRGSTNADRSPEPAPLRRKSTVAVTAQERGRERRLFGAALGALSRPATTAQNRRSQIESRQRARLQHEEEDNKQRKMERMAHRTAQREVEQKKFEESMIRVRHEALLNMAHFLKTSTEPVLYYKPWETTPEEDDLIADQISEVRTIMEKESAGLRPQQPQEDHRERDADRSADARRPESKQGKELDEEAPQLHSAINGATNVSEQARPRDRESNEDHADASANEAVSVEPTNDVEEGRTPSHVVTAEDAAKDVLDDTIGEEMVEATEDTVIY